MKAQADSLKAAVGSMAGASAVMANPTSSALSLIAAGGVVDDLTKAQTDFTTKFAAKQKEMTDAMVKPDFKAATKAQLELAHICYERSQDIEKALALDGSPVEKALLEKHKLEAAV